MKNINDVDIAIVGTDIIGLALACSLKNSDLHIVVLENNSHELSQLHSISEIHVSTINIASEKLLSYLGIWKEIDFRYVCCYHSVEAWEKDNFGHITFNSMNIGYNHLGYVVKNLTIRSEMLKQIRQHNNIQLIPSRKIEKIIWRKNDVLIDFQCGSKLTTRLLIGSDSTNSWIRRKANIPTFCEGHYCALIATVKTTEPHGNIVRQVFHSDGILAFFPLSDPYLSSIFWSLESNKAKQILELTPKMFNQILSVKFDNRLGPYTVISKKPVIFPLMKNYAQKFIGHRLALISDAVHTMQPLAGQGINLGFIDAILLSEEICRLHREGKDIGHRFYLERCEKNRKCRTIMLADIQSNIYKLFFGSNPIKKLLRGVGLRIADNSIAIKLFLIHQIMGLNDLPKWLY